jgi:hypothetical protein
MAEKAGNSTEQALDIIRDGLRDFVEAGLKNHFEGQGNWIDAFDRFRRSDSYKGRKKNRQDRLPRLNGKIIWSPDELLKTISGPLWEAFEYRFVERQPRSPDRGKRPDLVAQGWVNELIEIRNGWAHRSADDSKRFLDTSERLLVAVGAGAFAENIRKLSPNVKRSGNRPIQPVRAEPIAILSPNRTIQKMLARLPPALAEQWRQTAIDGAMEVFSCPDGSGSYGGLEFEQIICDATNKEWPQDFGGLPLAKSQDLATALVGDEQLNTPGWLTQKGKPGRIRVLVGPIDPPNLDRPYIHMRVGNSDYFTPRTVSELEKLNREGKGPDLFAIFPESWAKPGSDFTTGCIPYHVSVQGIVLCRTADEADYLLLGNVNPQNPSITHGWGATMAEQMWAPDPTSRVTQWWKTFALKKISNLPIPPKRNGDPDLRENLRRGLHEELGIVMDRDTLHSPRLLSVAIEDNFFITFIFLVIVGLELDEVYRNWKSAPDRNELGLMAAVQLTGFDGNGAALDGPQQLANLMSREMFDAGPHLLPSARVENEIVGKWHCSSRLRMYAAGMHLWPEEFKHYVQLVN